MIQFKVRFAGDRKQIKLKFGTVHTVTQMVGGDPYTGPHIITPSATDQILSTAGTCLMEDIVIRKIPRQYGLITYTQDKNITIT